MLKIIRLVFCIGTTLVTASVLVVLGLGCASKPKGDPVAFTVEALAATDPSKINLVEKGSDTEKHSIEHFKSFNGDFSKSNILANTKSVYATDVYFRDSFKEIHGEPEFEAYLLRGADNVAEFSMDWKDVTENGGNYYFRWIMTLKLKRDGKDDPATRVTGISHVRFGHDGKVVFHHDYFDGAGMLYEKIPVLRGMIWYVKKRV
jgi:hypothetical protein